MVLSRTHRRGDSDPRLASPLDLQSTPCPTLLVAEDLVMILRSALIETQTGIAVEEVSLTPLEWFLYFGVLA